MKITTDGLETKSVDFSFVGQYEAEGHTLNFRLKCQGKGSSFYNEGRCTKNENRKYKNSDWLNYS